MADVLDNAENALTPMMRNLIDILGDEWKTIEEQIDDLTDRLEQMSVSNFSATQNEKKSGIIRPLFA